MRSPSISTVLALVLLSVGSCTRVATRAPISVTVAAGSLSDPTTVASVAGCYDLTRTRWYMLPPVRMVEVEWPDSLTVIGDSTQRPEHEPPAHVKLLLTPAARHPTWRTIEPRGPLRVFAGSFPGSRLWRVVGDTVVAHWSDGFAGVALTLRPTSFGLEGTAVAFTDVIGPSPIPAARVTLLRTRCRD